jgi:hypothetical protein
VELAIEPGEVLIQLRAQPTGSQPTAIGFGGSHLDELLATPHQFVSTLLMARPRSRAYEKALASKSRCQGLCDGTYSTLILLISIAPSAST